MEDGDSNSFHVISHGKPIKMGTFPTTGHFYSYEFIRIIIGVGFRRDLGILSFLNGSSLNFVVQKCFQLSHFDFLMRDWHVSLTL